MTLAGNLSLVLAAVLLVLLNGAFVAAEFAIVKLRSTQADELGDLHGLRGLVLQKIHANLDAYLSSCQLGITLASLGLGWIGEPAFARLMEPVLAYFGVVSHELVQGIAFAVAFTLISFLHIVLGELAPKTVALRQPEAVSLATAVPLYVFYWGMYPFIFLLNATSNVVVAALGVKETHGDAVHSREELHSVLAASHTHGEFGAMEARVLSRGLELGELIVGDIMEPVAQLVTLSLDESIEQVLAQVRTTQFSRYPMLDPETDAFAGLLVMKDLITASGRLRDIKDLRPFLRKLQTVKESDSLPMLLANFRRGASHFSIVTDIPGTVIGFVTFEHVVEAFLGPVNDEFRKDIRQWHQDADGSVTGAASLSLMSLEDVLGTETPEVDANSVGGLVIEHLGRIPKPGERVTFPDFEIEIITTDGPRIDTVQVRPRRPADDADDTG
jgi:CBS domain containing-hemolysin-like protein